MKRIISVVLSIVLLLNIFTVLAWAGTVKNDDLYNESIRFIRAIDIMSKYTDTDFMNNPNVTRAEFAGILADIVNYKGETGISKECTMLDVTSDNEYAEAIGTITNLGYMKGNGSGAFYPDNFVTASEAIKTVVSMAGFDLYAQKRGGYPTGYLVAANELGILKGVNTSGDLNLQNLAKIIYNLRNVFIMKPSYYTTDGEISYSLYHDGTAERFMHKYFGAYYFEGLLTSNGITALRGESSSGRDYVEVNGVEYKIDLETSYAINFIGRRVQGYYMQDETTQIKNLIYIYQDDEQEFLTFDIEDYANLEGTTLTYYLDADHNEEEEIELVSVPYVIFNGKYATKLQKAFFEDYEYGTVTLTSSTFDNDYDTVIIEAYYSGYVIDADAPNNTVYLSYDSPEVPAGDEIIENTSKNIISVFDVNGNPLEFKNITSYSFIDIAKKDNVYKIIVNEKGYKQGFNVASVDENYYSNGTDEYFVSDKYLSTTKNVIQPQLGNTYNVFVNSFGAIVWFEAPYTLSEYKVGYLIQYATDGRGLSSNFSMKILTENGRVLTFNAAQKVKITQADGISEKVSYSKLGEKINNYKGVIQYKESKENEISEILIPGTVDNPANDTVRLSTFYKDDGTAYEYRNSILNKKVAIDNSTVIFSIAEGLEYTDESDIYRVMSKAGLKPSNGKYRATAYNFEKDSVYANYMVIYDSSEFTYGTTLAYVDKVLESTDFEGEPTVIIKGYEANTAGKLNPVEFTVSKAVATSARDASAEQQATDANTETYSIQKGDIIKYYKTQNEVENILLVYRSEKPSYNPLGKKGMLANSTGYYNTTTRAISNPIASYGSDYFYAEGYVVGYIVNIDSLGNITYTTQDLSVEEYDPTDSRFVTGAILYPKYTTLVTKKGDNYKVSMGELSDLRSYKAVGNRCTKIFLQTRYGAASTVFIFND